MKYFYFHRENSNFDDIMRDTTCRRHYCTVITWPKYLMLAVDDSNNASVCSYLALKYNDDLVREPLFPDRTPQPGRDYMIRWPADYTGPKTPRGRAA